MYGKLVYSKMFIQFYSIFNRTSINYILPVTNTARTYGYIKSLHLILGALGLLKRSWEQNNDKSEDWCIKADISIRVYQHPSPLHTGLSKIDE